jgi:hypothetical protein
VVNARDTHGLTPRELEVLRLVAAGKSNREISSALVIRIELPIFGEDGQLLHDRGVVGSEPGLYFVGLLFQYAVTSDVLPGVGRDAEHVAKQLVSRERRATPTSRMLARA